MTKTLTTNLKSTLPVFLFITTQALACGGAPEKLGETQSLLSVAEAHTALRAAIDRHFEGTATEC